MDKFFGYHLYLRSLAQLENAVEAVEKYVAPLGLNAFIMEVDDIFVFKNKEMTEPTIGDITPEALKALCARLRAVGVEPIPLYNCLGHQGWEHRNGMLQAHPELDEAPEVPDEVYHHTRPYYTPQWCPSNDKVFDYVFPAIDELIEVTGCKTFHIGMDEVFLFGICDKCKGKAADQLYGDTVVKLYNHIKEKGVKTMMWGDRFLDGAKLTRGIPGGKSYEYEMDFTGAHKIINWLPKDIIVCDWHYDVEPFYPSIRELLSFGFTTIPSVWYGMEAAEKFYLEAVETAKKMKKEDLLPGVIVTDWAIHKLTDSFTAKKGEIRDADWELGRTFERIAELLKD